MATTKSRPVGVRLATATIDRVELVRSELVKTGAVATKNDVLRVAIEAGLERLEAELNERKAA